MNEFTNGKHKGVLHFVKIILDFSPKNNLFFKKNKILVRKTQKIDYFRNRWKSTTSVFFTFSAFAKAILSCCQRWLLSLSLVSYKAVRCHK